MACLDFPPKWTPEEGLPKYLKFRAEGQSFWKSAIHFFDYIKKYKKKKFSAPKEVIEYFDIVRARLPIEIENLKKAQPVDVSKSLSLTLFGDVMPPFRNENEYLTPEVRNYLACKDVVLGNFETPFAKKKGPCFEFDFYRFNSEESFLKTFLSAEGRALVTAASLANNHIFDHGPRGVKDTLDSFKTHGILTNGVSRKDFDAGLAGTKELNGEDPEVLIFEKGGIKFGFYAATWGLNSDRRAKSSKYRCNTIDINVIAKAIEIMRKNGSNFNIISLHWGYEYELYPDPSQIHLAHKIIEAGAHLILGHHPHVIQPMEIVGFGAHKGLILYSLGNFITRMESPLCDIGALVTLNLLKDSEGQLIWSFEKVQLVHNSAVGVRLVSPEKLEAPSGGLGESFEFLKKHLGLNL